MRRILVSAVIVFMLFIVGCLDNTIEPELELYAWDVSSPAAQGIDSRILDSAFIEARRAGFIDALLVIRNGRIVAEEYYNGFSANTPHNIMSVTKSFLSTLTGIALHDNVIDNLDEKMLDYFPEYVYPEIDRRKYDITLMHLLTMRMGIEDESYNFFEIYRSDNWIKTTIEYPLAFPPGEGFAYNSFETHLLSVIISKSSRKSTKDFAETFLTGPLGISIDYWEQGPDGYYFGGSGLHIVPREMALLGYLYLNEGRLNDTQIVPDEWVEFALRPSTDWQSGPWGALTDYNYGCLWWLGKINDEELFMGYGWGGQFVVVFPNLNLIVVSTADNDVDSDTSTEQEWAIFDIISRYILPAVR